MKLKTKPTVANGIYISFAIYFTEYSVLAETSRNSLKILSAWFLACWVISYYILTTMQNMGIKISSIVKAYTKIYYCINISIKDINMGVVTSHWNIYYFRFSKISFKMLSSGFLHIHFKSFNILVIMLNIWKIIFEIICLNIIFQYYGKI